MKSFVPTLLLALAVPLTSAPSTRAFAAGTVLPAGSIIQCTISEPKLSSKTDKIGDPVLCSLSHAEQFGRATVPYGSYLVGQFVDYKDPGHFVGKGYVELRFDRLVMPYRGDDTTLPLDARVVSVPNYRVDQDGKILGNGHAVRDTVEWFIPVLWPLDIINLPRRGPRVVLKPETRLTLKVMDDVGIPPVNFAQEELEHPGLQQRNPAPIQSAYQDGYQAYAPQQQPYQQAAPAPIVQAYAQPPAQTIIYNNYAAPQAPPQQQQQVVVVQAAAPQQAPAPRPVYVQRPPVVYGYPAPYPYYYHP
jgi:hypothetical protein